MRHVYICQEQAYLAHGRTTFNDNETVIYLVDDRSLQRKLAKDGCLALCGDLRDGRIYQRAHITQEDDVLIQVNSPQLTQDIVHYLWRIPHPPSMAVIFENGHRPTLPPPVKHISVDKLLSQAARTKLRQARDHQRVRQMRTVLEDCENLLILIQHDPDPDAIASGLALRTLLGRNKTTARIGSFGQVTRPEKVAMVQPLGFEHA